MMRTTRPMEPAGAPRLRQTTIRLTVPTIAPAPVAGVQALRAELAWLEREARRYFAQQAPTADKQTQQRAATLRRQLAELEVSAASRLGVGAPAPMSTEQSRIAPLARPWRGPRSGGSKPGSWVLARRMLWPRSQIGWGVTDCNAGWVMAA
jgi:hypothetical protein